MRRSDIPHDVNEQFRVITHKILCVMLMFEYGDTGTHHSRDVRDKQIKILLKQIYESLTGDSLWYTNLPRIELWHEKTSIFDDPEPDKSSSSGGYENG